MPSIYARKPTFQSLLRPLTKQLAAIGVSANQVTVFSIILSIVTGATVILFQNEVLIFLLVPVVLFIRMALNAIDGMLAREHDMKTALGALLNELGDVFSDIALYLPFAFISFVNPVVIVLLLILAVISEMTGVIGAQIGGSRRYDGPMGKSDRALLFGIISLLWGLEFAIGPFLNFIFIITTILLCLTIVSRAKAAIHEVTPS